MLKLKSVDANDDKRLTTITYELLHVTPGRDGTHLKLDLKVEVGFGAAYAQIADLRPKVPSEDPELAMDKLAEWLERAACAIRARKPCGVVIQAYGCQD